MIEDMPYKSLQIGNYNISWIGAYLWIENTATGEGGSFDPKKFEAIVDKFYQDNF